MLADIVASGLGVLGFQWQTSPACTELEEVREGRGGRADRMDALAVGMACQHARHGGLGPERLWSWRR